MKKIFLFLCTAIFLLSAYFYGKEAEKPLRLHIIANSDSTEDQAMKFIIRDEILRFIGKIEPKSKEDAELFVFRNMTEIEEIVNKTLAKHDAAYFGKLETGIFAFPEKDYGEKIYPAGDYEAIRIILGEGKGQNWWCVVFPPLCLSADAEEYRWGFMELISYLETQLSR